MTEIKAVDCKTFWKRSAGEIITYTEGSLMDIIQLARKDILSLITTIESQQEKISELDMEMVLTERVVTQKKEMLKDVEKRMSEVIDSRDKALDEIESLKAITELAVKGLKEISWDSEKAEFMSLAGADNFRNFIMDKADDAILKIKGLTHEQT